MSLTTAEKLDNALSYYVFQCTTNSKVLVAAFALETDADRYLDAMNNCQFKCVTFVKGNL